MCTIYITMCTGDSIMNNNDIKTVREMVNILLGKRLFPPTRAANMICIHFDDDKAHRYAVHIQCAFRFTLGGKIIVGYEDLFQPNSEIGSREDFSWENFSWDVQGNNQFDEQNRKFFCEESLKDVAVKKVNVNRLGDLNIAFSNGLALEIFNNSCENEENWRFFELGNIDSHLVISGTMIENEDE